MRTSKKVEVTNGMQHFVRTVYVNEYGHEYFKYQGKECYIYKRKNGTYTAPWFTRVEFI